MIRVNDVFDRVAARATSLAGRLQGASAFAQLVANKAMPQATPAAFVLHGSLTGGAPALASGFFRQDVVETVSIVLIVRVANDPTGKAALDELTPIVTDIVSAVAGWAPDDCPGVFVLSRGELVGAEAGALIYQLDFRLDDQLRITP